MITTMNQQTCIYCGVNEACSVDHFPPKLALRKPYPPNLTTLPACQTCNNGFSKDEEYYRMIVFGLFCFSNLAEEIFDGPMTRSFERRPHLQDKMFGSIGRDGDQPYVMADHGRLERIILKMAIGLHFLGSGFRPSLQSWINPKFYHSEPVPNNSRLSDIHFEDSFAPDFRYKFWMRPENNRYSLCQFTHFDEVHWVVEISPRYTNRPYDPDNTWAVH
jgi:hypothetical protein